MFLSWKNLRSWECGLPTNTTGKSRRLWVNPWWPFFQLQLKTVALVQHLLKMINVLSCTPGGQTRWDWNSFAPRKRIMLSRGTSSNHLLPLVSKSLAIYCSIQPQKFCSPTDRNSSNGCAKGTLCSPIWAMGWQWGESPAKVVFTGGFSGSKYSTKINGRSFNLL